MEENAPGKVTIAPEVLVTIVQLTAQEIPGIYRMSADWTRDVNRFLGNARVGDGVQVQVRDGRVSVDLYLIVEHNVSGA